MKNSSGENVGMFFAGKQKSLVYAGVAQVIGIFIFFAGLAMAVAVVLSRRYATRMISDINGIHGYLQEIAAGNLAVSLDADIQKRADEIGEMGKAADKMRENLRLLIETDPLTKLLNRRSCNKKLKAIFEKQEEFSIVMGDIDFFKKINDTYGHDAGDYCLQEISRILQENVGERGFVGRWGGEEFLLAITLPVVAAKEVVEQIRRDIKAFAFSYQNQKIEVTMTFGICAYEASYQCEEMIKTADDRLYVGKRNGRDCIVWQECV